MLVRNVRWICAASISRTSSVSCCSATLFTRMSVRPNLSSALSTADLQNSPADVAGNQNRLASFTFHQFACLVGVLVFLEIDDRNLRALARHGDRDGASDPAVSTRDERYFVF